MDSTSVTTTYRNILGQMPPLPILTEHLVIRPLLLSGSSDQAQFHDFFARHQTLADTSRAIAYLTNTKNGSLCLGIFLQSSDKSEGDMIGIGGIRDASTQGTWPIFNWEIIHPAHRSNKSLGIEFANAFMNFWWSIPTETGEFRLQVPVNTVGYPKQDGTTVTARVIALAQFKNSAKQHALAEAGFAKYSVAMGEAGMETYWRQIDPRTGPQPGRPSISAPLHPVACALTSGKSQRKASENAMVARIGLQSNSVDKRGAKNCQQQQPSEAKPSNTEMTQAIWHMLAEELERDKLDVFQLQDFHAEGYIPSLSKKFGVPLENRRGEIWVAFRVCLTKHREHKATAMQSSQPNKALVMQARRPKSAKARQANKSQSALVKSKKAPVLQTSDGSGIPPLRLPPGELPTREEKGRNVRKRLTKGCVRSGGARGKS